MQNYIFVSDNANNFSNLFLFFIIFCPFEAKTSNVAAKRMLLERPLFDYFFIFSPENFTYLN